MINIDDEDEIKVKSHLKEKFDILFEKLEELYEKTVSQDDTAEEAASFRLSLKKILETTGDK